MVTSSSGQFRARVVSKSPNAKARVTISKARDMARSANVKGLELAKRRAPVAAR